MVHVCQKWRCVVFGSQRRLNIQLACRPTTPVREMLDIWPPLPIVIQQHDDEPWQPIWGRMSSLRRSSIRSVCSALLPRLFPIGLGSNADRICGFDPDSFLGGSVRVGDISSCNVFHFRDYRNCCRLPLTLLTFAFLIFPVMGIFHPKG